MERWTDFISKLWMSLESIESENYHKRLNNSIFIFHLHPKLSWMKISKSSSLLLSLKWIQQKLNSSFWMKIRRERSLHFLWMLKKKRKKKNSHQHCNDDSDIDQADLYSRHTSDSGLLTNFTRYRGIGQRK